MILKKPYAFFIKMFKPIHLLLAFLVGFLFYLDNNILRFLNEYIYSTESLVGKEQLGSLITNYIYIIPIIMIVLFFLFLGIMYKKKKPILFYFVGILVFVVVLVINIYTVNFLNVLSENVVSVKSIKLIHDLVLINIILESLYLLLLFIRGIGLDFKKFDFNSDISKFEISDSDKEEFEVNINIDFNEKKRRRREKIRNIKYLYIENKLLVNIGITIFVGLIIFLTIFFINKRNNVNKEGIYYNASSFTFRVNNSTILNTDYQGKKITDNYLIVVDTNMKANFANKSLYLNDFTLKIENIRFKPIKKYFDNLVDIGLPYNEQILPFEYKDYIFVFEIPEKYINSEMYFSYNSEGNVVDVLLEPKELVNNNISNTKQISESIVFDNVLSGVEFKINSYDLNYKYLIEYNYCIKKDDCIISKEYLKPSIDENYDKVILKLNINYKSSSSLKIDDFYSLLSKFGMISYKKNNTWHNIYKFEEIKSKKVASKNDIYIGLNSNIIDSESIKLIFDIRGSKYEYLLK